MDEFHNVGGSYVVDPETGARKLVERTQDPRDTAPADAAAPDTAKTED